MLGFYGYMSERVAPNTIDSYISMIRGWHIQKVGYAPAQSAVFATTELTRVQKGDTKVGWSPVRGVHSARPGSLVETNSTIDVSLNWAGGFVPDHPKYTGTPIDGPYFLSPPQA